MSELSERDKALMHRVYEEMWNPANLEVASEIFERPAGVERFVNQFLLSFPDLQHTVEGMIAEGEQIAVRFTAKGTHRGGWLEFAPTNRVIQYSGVTWARIVDGRILEHHTWWDKAGLIEQVR
jgi:predicted ester cyclase